MLLTAATATAVLEAAAVLTESDLVVVVVVTAEQWRFGKTTAGMTDRALDTNWPASVFERRRRGLGPHAHAPGGRTYTIDFSPYSAPADETRLPMVYTRTLYIPK